jgi:hypothetical protein
VAFLRADAVNRTDGIAERDGAVQTLVRPHFVLEMKCVKYFDIV